MPNNIFGSSIPDGLSLTPAANSSDDKYVQGISPSRSTPVANASVDSISKSGFYYNTTGSVKPTIHVETSSPLVKMQMILDSSGLSYRQKYGTTTWSDVKYVVTRDGNQYIQSITTDNITALNIPLSTSTIVAESTSGLKYKPNANAALTNDIAIRAMFKPNGNDTNYPGGGYGVNIIAPSQNGRIGGIEVNEFGKVYSTYNGWFHENYLNKVNSTSGTYTVTTGPGTVAMRFIGDGMGWGTQIEVEGSFDPANPVYTGSGASITYHKPGVVRWKSGVCAGGGEIYDFTEYHFRTGFTPGSTQGTLQMAIGSSGHIWTSAYGHLHTRFSAASDKKLKKNIKDVKEDSLYKIEQIEFKSFDYKDEANGKSYNVGAIAQDLEQIDPTWVQKFGEDDTLYLDTHKLLMAAMHGIQQLNKKVEELEKKLESK